MKVYKPGREGSGFVVLSLSMKTIFLLMFPALLFAQDPTALARPQIRQVSIFGQPYVQIKTSEGQVLVKQRTDESPPTEEDKPTVENEYDRLPVLSLKWGMSEHFFSKQDQPQIDQNGNVEPGESYYNMGIDYGFAFRIPANNNLKKLSTGIMFNFSKTDTPTVMEEHRTYTFNNQKDVMSAIFGQWTAFADYDLLVFRGRGTKTLTVGAYVDNYIFNTYTCCGDDNNDVYTNKRHMGGLLRYKIIRSEGSKAFGRWEVSVYAGQGKTFHVALAVENPLFKKRVNPPVRRVK